MGVFDNLSKTVTDAGNKTKDISETIRLNSLVAQNGKEIEGLYTKIGETYVSMHKDRPDAEFIEYVDKIKELELQNDEYRLKIERIKGTKKCKSCGAEISKDSIFCNVCGTKCDEEPDVAVNSNVRKCSKCGAELLDDARFCIVCGATVDESEFDLPVIEEPVVDESEFDLPVIEVPVVDKSEFENEEKSSKSRFCTYCGYELDQDALFCENCGHKVE